MNIELMKELSKEISQAAAIILQILFYIYILIKLCIFFWDGIVRDHRNLKRSRNRLDKSDDDDTEGIV